MLVTTHILVNPGGTDDPRWSDVLDALWCEAGPVLGCRDPGALDEAYDPSSLAAIRLQQLQHPRIVAAGLACECPADHVGDMEVADQTIGHQPVIDDGEECICLVMTEGSLRLKNVFARMAQPFIGL